MPQDDSNLIAYAVHEAGHAVAAAVLGIPLSHVTVQRDEWAESGGHCAADPWALPAFDHAERDTFAAAGGVAQVLAGDMGGFLPSHVESDQRGVILAAAKRHKATTHTDVTRRGNRAWANACRAAERILSAHWLAVLAVAGLLVQERMIPGDVVVAAVKMNTTETPNTKDATHAPRNVR